MILYGLSTGSQPGVRCFIVIAEFQFCAPHESFICLQNNILVMLSVLNFIPDCRSSKTCMWTVTFLKLENH